jgi:hypothetical protein
MFNYKLLELESERLAKLQSTRAPVELAPESLGLIEFLEQEVGVTLAAPVPRDWAGWLSYRRHKNSLVIIRGRAFRHGMLGRCRAGMDVPYGVDSIGEYQRGFDVSPPQDLDHLLVNFGGEVLRVFLWYGENIAPYKLIFMADVADDPHRELSEAVGEACVWIMQRPKGKTLSEFLHDLSSP